MPGRDLRPSRLLLPMLAAGVLTAACGAPAAPPTAAPAEGPACPSGVTTPEVADVAFDHATNVTLTAGDGYQVLTVAQPFPGGAPEATVLVPCGTAAPELPADLAAAPQLTVPVTSLYSASTTHLGMIAEIGAVDVLTGVGTPDFVSTPVVRERIDAGEVTGFAADGVLNTEQVLAGDPDVLLSQGTDDPGFVALRSGGVPVLGWAEYLETGPLAQAEWIKVMGALTGRGAEADIVFGEIDDRYQQVVDAVADVEPVPVLLGSPFQGTWSVPAGGSTAGILARDARATWSEVDNTDTGSVSKDFETVFATDGSAPVWITSGPFPTRADVLAADARYGELAAVASGQVWTRDRLLGATGGNELFERGVTHPDEVLTDLVTVLHPGVLPDAEPIYSQQVAG